MQIVFLVWFSKTAWADCAFTSFVNKIAGEKLHSYQSSALLMIDITTAPPPPPKQGLNTVLSLLKIKVSELALRALT